MLTWDADPTGWDEAALEDVKHLARDHHSTDVVVLQGDRVVVDAWWEADDAARALVAERLDDGRVRQDVASTQKSITSVLAGFAVGHGIVARTDRVSDRIGDGWTGTANPPEVERAITLDHLLTMTSGLADDLSFVAAPGTWWDYNLGAAYHTVKRVLTAATGRTIDDLTDDWLTTPLGMGETEWARRRWDERMPPRLKASFAYPDGEPIEGLVTTARDLALFGRAVLRGCVDDDGRTLGIDDDYRSAMVRPSQSLNPAYGLLWWLNGQERFLPPKVQTPVEGPFLPGVPDDAYAAMGANDRMCVVVPSLDLVVTRCGAAAGERSAAGSSFGRELLRRIVAAAPERPF